MKKYLNTIKSQLNRYRGVWCDLTGLLQNSGGEWRPAGAVRGVAQ